MNRACLTGRVTKELQLQQSAQQSYVKFTLAVDRMKKDEADFINCTAFGKTAEAICKYSGKGKKLGVEGRIQTGSYQKQDGTKVYTTDVIVDHADILEFNQAPQQNGYQQQPPAYQQGYQSAMQNPPPQFQQTVHSAQMPYQQPAPQYQQQTMNQYQAPQQAPPQDGWMQAPPQEEGLPFA